MKNRTVLLTCYRALLRWADRCQDAPIRIKPEHLQAVCPAAADMPVVASDASSFRNVVQWEFRRRESARDSDVDPVARALSALRTLNKKYYPVLQELEEERQNHMDRTGIKFKVGEVVQHSRRGYRAVITGWDRVCENINLLEDTEVNFVQPFYKVITDESSLAKSTGQKGWFKYLPQDQVQVLKTPKRISNAKVQEYFDQYSPELSRYIPKQHIQWKYPDEYSAPAVQPCSHVAKKLCKSPNVDKSSEKPKTRKKEKMPRKAGDAKFQQTRRNTKSLDPPHKNLGSPTVKSVTEK